MKKRWLLILPAVILGAPCLWWVFVVNATELQARTTVREFHVPSGFSGWATLKYGVATAPALKATADGLTTTTIVPFPASGLLETSDPMPKGHSTPRWFKADRGGAVLIAWTPAPFELREVWSPRCFHVYVPPADKPLRSDEDAPSIPDRGCDQ